jgi:hypothetical protein
MAQGMLAERRADKSKLKTGSQNYVEKVVTFRRDCAAKRVQHFVCRSSQAGLASGVGEDA